MGREVAFPLRYGALTAMFGLPAIPQHVLLLAPPQSAQYVQQQDAL